MKKKKILITGCTGFVGTNLIPMLLEQGYEVSGIDNLSQSEWIPEFHDKLDMFYHEDIRDAEAMNKIFMKEKPYCTFHFAGLVSIYDCDKNPSEAADNNIIGSLNVFNAALNAGCPRVIFSESSAVYENCDLPEDGYNETQSDPVTFYSTTKAAVALIAESLSRTKGLKYTALRYFNIAGPIQDYKRTIPPLFAGVALRLLGGNNPIIFGDGTRRRDFIHVKDVNDFHLMCINDPFTIDQTYNLGTGHSHSLFEIAEIVHSYLGITDRLEYDMFPEINGEAHTIFADIEKATSLHWTPRKTIEDCIFDTIDYLKIEIQKGNINPKTYMIDLDITDIKIEGSK